MKTIISAIAFAFLSATAAHATLEFDSIFGEQQVYGEFVDGSIFSEQEIRGE